jgi:hypothetical protein
MCAPSIANASIAIPEAPQGLIRRARIALDLHGPAIGNRDRMAVVDFSAPSRMPRFHIIDLMSGRQRALLVAHGRGSDPDHSGWLERFSNAPGSQASSAGAYLTGDLYMGKHGRSRRLLGLDPGNSNAEARAIVIHAASYVTPALADEVGKLGRSEGCLAVAQDNLEEVLATLGSGRLIYVDKV